MAKTKAQKLQEALEAGDIETAKKLAAELAPKPKASPKKKAAAKPKASAKKTTVATKKTATKRAATPKTSAKKSVRKTKTVEAPVEDAFDRDDPLAINPLIEDDGIFRPMDAAIAAQRSGGASSQFVNKTKARLEPVVGPGIKPPKMEIIQATSEFVTDKKAKGVPRPGQPGAERDEAETMDVVCGRCGKRETIFTSHFDYVDEEAEYRCNRCTKRR